MGVEETLEPLDMLVDKLELEGENELIPDGTFVVEEPECEVFGIEVAVTDTLLGAPDAETAEELVKELLRLN